MEKSDLSGVSSFERSISKSRRMRKTQTKIPEKFYQVTWTQHKMASYYSIMLENDRLFTSTDRQESITESAAWRPNARINAESGSMWWKQNDALWPSSIKFSNSENPKCKQTRAWVRARVSEFTIEISHTLPTHTHTSHSSFGLKPKSAHLPKKKRRKNRSRQAENKTSDSGENVVKVLLSLTWQENLRECRRYAEITTTCSSNQNSTQQQHLFV